MIAQLRSETAAQPLVRLADASQSQRRATLARGRIDDFDLRSLRLPRNQAKRERQHFARKRGSGGGIDLYPAKISSALASRYSSSCQGLRSTSSNSRTPTAE